MDEMSAKVSFAWAGKKIFYIFKVPIELYHFLGYSFRTTFAYFTKVNIGRMFFKSYRIFICV